MTQGSDDLALALQSLWHSCQIIYGHYRWWFLALIATLGSTLSYKLGALLATDELEQQKKTLLGCMRDRQRYRCILPKKLQFVSFMRKAICAVLGVTVIGWIIMHLFWAQLINSWTDLTLLLTSIIVLIVITVLLFLYQKYLNMSQSNLQKNESRINLGITKLLELLGKRVVMLLRTNLCREYLLSLQKIPPNVCSKLKCQQDRRKIKLQEQRILNLVENVVTFEWCSTCRKRASFDELLAFEPYEFHSTGSEEEQDEIDLRNVYLLGEIERMCKWLKQVQPCNCSKLYWEMSTRAIIQHKKLQKAAEEIERKGQQPVAQGAKQMPGKEK